jgi:Xaa-Pro aminopeptidase
MTDRIMGFSPETFETRRARVLEKLDGGMMILTSAPKVFRSRDTEHRYRPDSELFYLTGCTQPGVVALFFGGDGEDRFSLFVPPRELKAERWSGPRMGPEAARERFGADSAHSVEDLDERLPKLLRRSSRLYFRLGFDPRIEPLVVAALHWSRARGSRKGEGPRAVVDPGQILDDLRLRKDPEEIVKIKQATSLTVAGFREAMAGARPGMGEWEVESLLESAFRRAGATGPAFPTIVGSGGNACTLHYVDNEHTIHDGELVLLDGGAEVDLYAGDVSRTFPAGGRYSGPQKAVYEVVLAAHQAALEVVRPGTLASEVHQTALNTLISGLVELEVLEGDVDRLMEDKSYERFFPHQTSHWLGMDVHDVGDYGQGGSPRSLEEGMVLTVEPGLYFSALEEDPVSRFSGIGVRIEDDVLVTRDGAVNLTDRVPVSVAEVEDLVGSA